MDKYIYDVKNGFWYELQGDYYLPCLKLPEERTAHIGIWGQRHLRYLKQHRKVLYSNLLLWIALLFISGGAVTATTVYGRKKKHSVK